MPEPLTLAQFTVIPADAFRSKYVRINTRDRFHLSLGGPCRYEWAFIPEGETIIHTKEGTPVKAHVDYVEIRAYRIGVVIPKEVQDALS